MLQPVGSEYKTYFCRKKFNGIGLIVEDAICIWKWNRYRFHFHQTIQGFVFTTAYHTSGRQKNSFSPKVTGWLPLKGSHPLNQPPMRPISPSLAGVLGALEPGPDLPEAAAQVDGVQRKDDDASRTTEGNQQRRSHDADGDGHDDESRAAHALDGHRLERAGEELDQSVEDLLGADQHDEKEGEGENRAGENHLKTP